MSSQKSTLLIVDDKPENIGVLFEFLDTAGFEVLVAESGEDALENIQHMMPDLILLDIMMPGINGFEICQQVKSNPQTQDIPIILMTALTETVDKVKGFKLGAVDYITKPFQVEEVLMRVQTHLTLRRLQQQLQTQNQQLQHTLDELQSAQAQLVHAEKMAALGQLVTNVAHEINTPLGAIRSSIEHITQFLTDHLAQLPVFFHTLSPKQQKYFLTLFHHSIQQPTQLTARQKRQAKKQLTETLQTFGINNAKTLANIAVDINIYENVEDFLPLFQAPKNVALFKMAYQLTSVHRSACTSMTAIELVSKIIFSMKNFYKVEHFGHKITVDLIDGIETVLTLYRYQFKQGIEIKRYYERSLPQIFCYPNELNQVWTHLIHNALYAMGTQGQLIIRIYAQVNQVIVSITDSGHGIADDIKPYIFQPFFTTKPLGEGSGLGLDIVQKIIEKHRGQIEVDSMPGHTTFKVFLPIQ